MSEIKQHGLEQGRGRVIRNFSFLTTLVLLNLYLLLQPGLLAAQDYGSRLGTVKRGGKVSFEPRGPGVLFDALDPAVRKWYIPQELYSEYQWKQWEYSNYARNFYQRYVSTSLEGSYIYDVYGNYLTRGWLIFDWRQQNPQPFGSTLAQDGRFAGWFNQLVITSDHKGQYHYAITIGSQIRTTLTPMTFSKPRFNGIQWDFLADKYALTVLLSRLNGLADETGSSTGTSEKTNNTSLVGSRLEVQVGDFVKVGGTYLNAHHAQTQTELFNGNILKGNLTGVQNLSNVSFVEVVIKDDSPEDGEAGGALFAQDIVIWDLEGKRIRGSEIGFRPLVEGGFQRRGFLAADGREEIHLRYDLQDRSYTGPDPSEIERVQVELVLANDYLVEMASDRQTDFRERVVTVPVARAPGNVKDSSNQRVLALDYGLPTANQIAGFTVEVSDLEGFNAYLEVDINQQYKQYPNPNLERHHVASEESQAWMLNVSKTDYPYFTLLEAFDFDPNYQTGFQVVDRNGIVDYGSPLRFYEFVDDNDDQDRFPDWARQGSPRDRAIFPGWDENNDLISDFNQNDTNSSPNRVPDYEEPFLRYYTDRPEFLYGIDQNHNGWIDRFENDEEADYPYKRDRKGYNLYSGVFLHPDLRVAAGRQRMDQRSDSRSAHADYLMVAGDHYFTGWGRARVFQDLRSVEDDIFDHLVQWTQLPNSQGELVPTPDILPAQNTLLNTTWLGFDFDRWPGFKFNNMLKWQLYHQRDDPIELQLRGQREDGSFLGMINKAEYRLQLGKLSLSPAWKSEFRREAPVLLNQPERKELSQILLVVARFPVMLSSYLETGVEYHDFRQLRAPTPPGGEDSFWETTTVAQLTNISDYQGYKLTTVLGFDITRRYREVEGTRTRTRGFLTVYAGVEQ